MPLPKVHRNVVDQQGNIVPGVLGSVYNQGTGVLASLFSDDAGTVVLSNPMTNDASYGSFKFYINPGHYDMTFTKPGYTFEPIYDFQVPEDVLTLGTMSTQNANAVLITGGQATLSTIAVDTNLLYTDIVNHRLGVLTSTPQSTLHVEGNSRVVGQGLITAGLRVGSLVTPGFMLDVTGQARVSTQVGIGTDPVAGQALTTAGGHTVLGQRLLVPDAAGIGVGTIGAIGYNLHVQGTMGLNGGAAAIVNTTSTLSLKNMIRDIPSALSALLSLRGRLWNWREPQPGLPNPAGFVLEEVAHAQPQWVVTDTNGKPGLCLAGIEGYIIESLREITQRLEALEARLSG
jgi:hypothetical protein